MLKRAGQRFVVAACDHGWIQVEATCVFLADSKIEVVVDAWAGTTNLLVECVKDGLSRSMTYGNSFVVV